MHPTLFVPSKFRFEGMSLPAMPPTHLQFASQSLQTVLQGGESEVCSAERRQRGRRQPCRPCKAPQVQRPPSRPPQPPSPPLCLPACRMKATLAILALLCAAACGVEG